LEATLQMKAKRLQLKREKLKVKYPKLWLAKYHHRTTHNDPMTFGKRFLFFIDIYKEASKYIETCCRKSVQCGYTDFLIVDALDSASKGLRVFYVMPNQDLRNDFVKDRLNTLFKLVPYYETGIKEATGDSASVGLKHFYKGLINFVGSKSKSEFISFQADQVVIDEVDRCDQKNLEMAPDRMDGSKYKLDRRAGNPSVEGWGIDGLYSDSSQGVWKIKCNHCGKWQELDFFQNVVMRVDELQYDIIKGSLFDPKCVCAYCRKEIDRLQKGEWVHKFPSHYRRGYTISQMFSGNVSLIKLTSTWFKAIGNETKTQLFYNSKLGLPFSSAGSKLIYTLLEENANLRKRYVLSVNDPGKAIGLNRVYMGIDVGKYFHIVARQIVGNVRKLVYVGKLYSPEEVISIIRTIKPDIAVIDEKPELKTVENMKSAEGCKKLYSCDYQKGQTFLDIRKNREEYKKERRVKIDRTFLLDYVKGNFNSKKNMIPINARDLGNEDQEDYGEYYQHLLSSTRVYNEDNNSYEWREVGPDHYFHAEAYCEMAEQLDDRILDYYKKKSDEYNGMTKEEIDAKIKKKNKIVPKNKKKLELMRAEEFLRNLSNQSESFLGKMKKDVDEMDRRGE